MRKLFLVITALAVTLSSFCQKPIGKDFFGQNYWYTNYRNATSTLHDTLSTTTWSSVVASGVKIMRVGGKDYDWKTTTSALSAPDSAHYYYYLRIIDTIRAHNMDVMITMPFDTTKGIANQAENAGHLVKLLNKVHKRNVRYFILGNEPATDYGYTLTASSTARK